MLYEVITIKMGFEQFATETDPDEVDRTVAEIDFRKAFDLVVVELFAGVYAQHGDPIVLLSRSNVRNSPRAPLLQPVV